MPRLLLAVDLFEAMRTNFRPDQKHFGTSDLLQLVGVIVVVALAVWALRRAMAAQETDRRTNSPGGLFLELCRAQGLEWGEQWLLWRLAKAQGSVPAALFLRPEQFSPAKLPARLARHRARLESLKTRLFSESAPLALPDEPATAPLDFADLPASAARAADMPAANEMPAGWAASADDVWQRFGQSGRSECP